MTRHVRCWREPSRVNTPIGNSGGKERNQTARSAASRTGHRQLGPALLSVARLGAPGSWFIEQAVEPLLDKPSLPFAHHLLRQTQALGHRRVTQALRTDTHAKCPASIAEMLQSFPGCPSSELNPHRFIGGFARLAIACLHAHADQRSGPGRPVARSEPRTRTALLLEAIALRHQIAVLERSRTRRPCFRRFDRLFWILLSRWWPEWSESLMIVQPETVLRWHRNGWFAISRYRSRGRW